MNNIYLFLLILICFSSSINAQNKNDNKWKLSTNIGAAFPQNNFKVSNKSENILSFATVGNVINTQGDIRVYKSLRMKIRLSLFDLKMDDKKCIDFLSKNIPYNDYYVKTIFEHNPKYQNVLLSAGLINTFKINNLSISPGLSTSIISDFNTTYSARFDLKRKGSNYTKTIKYSISNNSEKKKLVLIPNLNISYDFFVFSKAKLGFSISADYYNQKVQTEIKESTFDIYFNKTQDSEIIKEDISLFNIYIGTYIRL